MLKNAELKLQRSRSKEILQVFKNRAVIKEPTRFPRNFIKLKFLQIHIAFEECITRLQGKENLEEEMPQKRRVRMILSQDSSIGNLENDYPVHSPTDSMR